MASLSTSVIARDRLNPVLITLRINPTFTTAVVKSISSLNNYSHSKLLNCRQRISVTCTSNLEDDTRKDEIGRRSSVRCQGHSSSSNQRAMGFEEPNLPNQSALLPPRLLVLPLILLAKATALLSRLRGTLHQCRLRLEALGQGADFDTKSLLHQGGLGMALLSTSVIARDRISPVLITLRSNPTFMSGLVAWALAQMVLISKGLNARCEEHLVVSYIRILSLGPLVHSLLTVMKVFTTYWVERRWDWKMLVGSGGMPSSHSALCVGLTTAVALCHGVSDSLFPVCLGFSLIVMYDAAGVRRHAGRQAEVLNMIVEDLFQGHPVSEKKLKELLGHTPLQVGAGAMLGIICGYLCSHASMIA